MERSKILNITNILLVVVVIMSLLFVYTTYGTYKNFSYEQNKMQVFYITNAGVNQALWYLSTPKNLGGFGPSFRIKELKKYFSIGSYTITVENGRLPNEIIITSIGEAKNITMMLQATAVYGRSLPPAFNYALFSNGELEIAGNSRVFGNIYINDNLRLKGAVLVTGGKVLLTPGYSVDGDPLAQFTKGSPKKPYPNFPVLDTSFYYEKISRAKLDEPDVIKGDKEYGNISLDGKNIHVNGNIVIKGGITGPGSIVATRNMTISGGGSIDDGVYLVCDGKLTISGKHNVLGNACLYSKQRIIVESGTVIKGGAALLSPTLIEIGQNCNLSGLIYGVTVSMGKNSKVEGGIAAENFMGDGSSTGGMIENVSLNYNQTVLPLTVAGFNMGTEIVIAKPGSLKEL